VLDSDSLNNLEYRLSVLRTGLSVFERLRPDINHFWNLEDAYDNAINKYRQDIHEIEAEILELTLLA
jgi:hypothetical protein